MAVKSAVASEGLANIEEQPPDSITLAENGNPIVDFGRTAFGNLAVKWPPGFTGAVVFHFGEAFAEGAVSRSPPGTVRYARVTATSSGHGESAVVAPPADVRNTRPPAVTTPPEWGVLLPFRWVEIEGWPEGEMVYLGLLRRRAAYASNWDDEAADFCCSDTMLNALWKLCHYSIKATTFAGLYVDGDRERIPYEADAYLNQLGHQACHHDCAIARATFDYLLAHPTWPTEWASHMPFMAYADWMYTGDREWIAERFEALEAKLMFERMRPDGLVASPPEHIKKDIVDWPPGERDNFVFTPLNATVNAFHVSALRKMVVLAEAIGAEADSVKLRRLATNAADAFHQLFFDADRGVYLDGVGTGHASLHTNACALAFDLVPAGERNRVLEFLLSKDMACSVYMAQYFMEALFANGSAERAVALMLAPGDRSWRHMVESGTSITWEAWDQRYKPNQDWNHAWGAAPVNLLPRFVAGVRELEPGWRRLSIKPEVGGLAWCRARVPSQRGAIGVDWRSGVVFVLEIELPADVSAQVCLPPFVFGPVLVNGAAVPTRVEEGRTILADDVRGHATICAGVTRSAVRGVTRSAALSNG